MKTHHEKLLIAALAGLVIASAATFAIQPAVAAGYHVEGPARVVGVKAWDKLNIRKWPAPYSKKIGALSPHTHVWVERCIENEDGGSDWCLVERGHQKGWVNSRFLELAYDTDI